MGELEFEHQTMLKGSLARGWDPLGPQPSHAQAPWGTQGMAMAETHGILSLNMPKRQTVLRGWPVAETHEISARDPRQPRPRAESFQGQQPWFSAKICWSLAYFLCLDLHNCWSSLSSLLLHQTITVKKRYSKILYQKKKKWVYNFDLIKKKLTKKGSKGTI